MTLYIIQSISGELLDRHLEWVKDAKPESLFQTPHKDVALNQLIELNAKDISLRARIVPWESGDRDQPAPASAEG
jgi:hypothetical protein